MDGGAELHSFRAQLGKSLTSAELLWGRLELLGGCLENRWWGGAGVSVGGETSTFSFRFLGERRAGGGAAS